MQHQLPVLAPIDCKQVTTDVFSEESDNVETETNVNETDADADEGIKMFNIKRLKKTGTITPFIKPTKLSIVDGVISKPTSPVYTQRAYLSLKNHQMLN